MKFFIVLLVIGTAAARHPGKDHEAWAKLGDAEMHASYKEMCKDTPGLSERSQEHVVRNLRSHIAKIRHNINTRKHTFQEGMTCMGHYSDQEFQSQLAAQPPAEIPQASAPTRRRRSAPPASVDWRTAGYVSPIKNQGNCGSCWSFSANVAIEACMAKKNPTTPIPVLSEQNFVDCVTTSYGCNRGWMTNAYDYSINANTGVDSSASYPYVAVQGTCNYNAQNRAGTVTQYTYTNMGDEVGLQTTLATVGPISIAIDASSIQSYTGGVITCPNACGTNCTVNHGVGLVGYGTDPTTNQPYWLVKNSWGTSWGEAGYFRIARNDNNQCCVSYAPNYLTFC